jgi:hypothetical protein
VGFWRRRSETLNEKLLREAGLEAAPPPLPHEGRVPGRHGFFDEVGVTGLHRLREWDATATVEAPELRGTELEFVVLPDGSVLVEEEAGDASVAPLADAIDEQLTAPYRARAVRRDGEVWAVAAIAIDVLDLRPDIEGDEIELVSRAGERTLTVDGVRSFGSIPQLEELGADRAVDFVVHASRLDGTLWEVRVDPL